MRLQSMLMAAALLLPAANADDDPTQVVAKAVRSLATAYDQGDVEQVKRLMTQDHEATLPYVRFSNRADQLKALADFKIVDYKIEGLQVKLLAKDSALATYRATINGTYKGERVPSLVLVVEVWIKRDDQWLQASYQETPIDRK
jgi:ketosteroid isomerase-like protein